jgi:hypothetical protein
MSSLLLVGATYEIGRCKPAVIAIRANQPSSDPP